MIRSIIIEDELPAARRLEKMLRKENVYVETVLVSIRDAENFFKYNSPPDLIFMDIHLSDGISFDIFKKNDLHASSVIFTTAYDKYALRAFKLNSIDYLLKPFSEQELHFAVEKYKKMGVKNISEIIRGIKNRTYKMRFVSRVGVHLRSFEISDIVCFYSRDKITYMVLNNGKEYVYDKSLGELEKLLDPTDFFRVNRKFIVSFKAIRDIVFYSNSRLKIILRVSNDFEIIVARERVRKFNEWINL